MMWWDLDSFISHALFFSNSALSASKYISNVLQYQMHRPCCFSMGVGIIFSLTMQITFTKNKQLWLPRINAQRGYSLQNGPGTTKVIYLSEEHFWEWLSSQTLVERTVHSKFKFVIIYSHLCCLIFFLSLYYFLSSMKQRRYQPNVHAIKANANKWQWWDFCNQKFSAAAAKTWIFGIKWSFGGPKPLTKTVTFN